MSKYGYCLNCKREIKPNYGEKKFCNKDCYYAYREKNRKEYAQNHAKALLQNVIKKHEKHLGIDDLEEWLRGKYEKEKLSYRQIMRMLNTKSNRTISKLLDYYNIKIRRGSEAVANQWTNNNKRREKQAEVNRRIARGNTYRRLSYKQLKDRYKKHGLTFLEREIKDGVTYVKYRCDACQNIQWQDYRNFGDGCPRCNANVSKGEEEIEEILLKLNTSHQREYKIEECKNINPLPFDFAIFDLGKSVILVEYHGIQHYEPIEYFGGEKQLRRQQKHDSIKRSYCKRNSIPLIEIPYWIEDIEGYLIKELEKLNIGIQLAL